MTYLALDQQWQLKDGTQLDTGEIFNRLLEENLDRSELCSNQDNPDWEPVAQRFQLVKRYGVIRELGEGAFGKVYLAFDVKGRSAGGKKGRLVALKKPGGSLLLQYAQVAGKKPSTEVDKNAIEKAKMWAKLNIGQLFSQEALLTARLNMCPYVVKVLDHDVSIPYMALEFCDGGALSERLSQSYGSSDIFQWAYEIASGLFAAHTLEPDQLIHRDLKPDNILISEGHLKISDFGTSQMIQQTESLRSLRGGYTPSYAAPEAFDGKANTGTDIWSFGVILYQLISGSLPFAGAGSMVELIKKISMDEVPSIRDNMKIHMPSPVLDLVHDCLDKESRKRPTAEECVQVFKGLSSGSQSAVIGDVHELKEMETGSTILEVSSLPLAKKEKEKGKKKKKEKEKKKAIPRRGKWLSRLVFLSSLCFLGYFYSVPISHWWKETAVPLLQKVQGKIPVREISVTPVTPVETKEKEYHQVEPKEKEYPEKENPHQEKNTKEDPKTTESSNSWEGWDRELWKLRMGKRSLLFYKALSIQQESSHPRKKIKNWRAFLRELEDKNPYSNMDEQWRREAESYLDGLYSDWVRSRYNSDSKRPGKETSKRESVKNFHFLGQKRYQLGKYISDIDIYRQEVTGIDFVLVPGGEFWMGDDSIPEAQPVHKVQIQPFLISQHPVTQGVWEKVLRTNPSQPQGVDLPVTSVSWIQCQEFCEQTGLRLPSEAEWEYANRAGNKSSYFWGEEIPGGYCWFRSNSQGRVQGVGQKRPNAFGLYDSSGNIWEWCQDQWQNNYRKAPDDGSPWIQNTDYKRVMRGGSYQSDLSDCRSAFRKARSTSDLFQDVGFRVVKDWPLD